MIPAAAARHRRSRLSYVPRSQDADLRVSVNLNLCPVDLYVPSSPSARRYGPRAGPPPGVSVRSTPERTFACRQCSLQQSESVP